MRLFTYLCGAATIVAVAVGGSNRITEIAWIVIALLWVATSARWQAAYERERAK